MFPQMSEAERNSALLTTLSAIIVEMGTIKELIFNIAPNGNPRMEPLANNSHSSSVTAFVYSAELKVGVTLRQTEHQSIN